MSGEVIQQVGDSTGNNWAFSSYSHKGHENIGIV